MFLNILNTLLIIVAIIIIILSLLQGGKSEGIISALTGQNSNLFAQQKERGSELIISRITMGLGIAFFVIAIMIRIS